MKSNFSWMLGKSVSSKNHLTMELIVQRSVWILLYWMLSSKLDFQLSRAVVSNISGSADWQWWWQQRWQQRGGEEGMVLCKWACSCAKLQLEFCTLACLPCTARFPTDHGPVLGHGPGLGTSAVQGVLSRGLNAVASSNSMVLLLLRVKRDLLHLQSVVEHFDILQMNYNSQSSYIGIVYSRTYGSC